MKISLKNAVTRFYNNSSFPMAIIEAVANAIDAQATQIKVTLEKQNNLPISLKIEDNGIGFKEDRYNRFSQLLDTEDDKHRGTGRLAYLRYFSSIHIQSVFVDNGQFYERKFIFNDKFSGTEGQETTQANKLNQTGTTLTFRCFNNKQISKLIYLDLAYYKEKLESHFFYTYISNPELKIELQVSENGNLLETKEIITAHNLDFQEKLFQLNFNQTPEQDLFYSEEPKDFIFRYAHTKQELSEEKDGQIFVVLVSDGRSYPLSQKNIKVRIPSKNSFYFVLESEFLNNRTTEDRDHLIDIPQNIFETLETNICTTISETIPSIEQNKKKDIAYIKNRYPHLIGYYDESSVDLGILDRREIINKAQKNFFESQCSILEKEQQDFKEEDYQKIFEISSHTLAQYILFREFTIEEFKVLEADQLSRNNEETLHNKLIPKSPKKETTLYNNNLWIVDDRFMTYTHALSNSEISTVMNKINIKIDHPDKKRRPDISLIFSKNPEKIGTTEKVQLAIIELKALGANDKEKLLGSSQILDYAEAITSLPEYKDKIDSAWFYLVTELNSEVVKKLKRDNGYTELFSLGDYPILHNEFKNELPVPVSVFVLSLSSLINDAKTRNHLFLDILKGKHT